MLKKQFNLFLKQMIIIIRLKPLMIIEKLSTKIKVYTDIETLIMKKCISVKISLE